MALEPISASSFIGFAKVLEFFRPTKSPYLVVVSAATICSIVSNLYYDEMGEANIFLFSIPVLIFISIFSIVPLILFNNESQKKEEDDIETKDQFRISRSIFLSVVIICITILTIKSEKNILFYVSYLLLIFNLITFSVYLLAREVKEEAEQKKNIIQIAFINAFIFLMIVEYVPTVKINDNSFWSNCNIALSFTADSKDYDGNILFDVDGNAIREKFDESIDNCAVNESDAKAHIENKYANVVYEGNVERTEQFAIRELYVIISLIISIIYYIFWVIALKSAIRIRVI